MRVRTVVGALAAAALLAAAVLVQVTEIASTRVLGGTPDLVVVVLCLLAIRTGSEIGALAGFATGLALDVLAQHALGRDALVLTVVAYGIGRIGERLRGRAIVRTVLAVALAAAAVRIGEGLLTFLLGDSGGLARAFSAALVSSAALAVLLALMLLPVMRKLLGRRGDPASDVRFAPLEVLDATAAV